MSKQLSGFGARALVMGVAATLVAGSAFAGFNVSSYKKTSSASTSSPYSAGAALDGNVATAWVINPEEENAGQWIEIGIPTSKIDKISFVVGWNRDPETWADHARVKEAKIEVIDEEQQDKVVWEKVVTFEDKTDRQVVELDDVAVGGDFNGGRVKMTVVSVFDGTDYAHLAMGEMLVHLTEFDVQTVKLEGVPSSEQDDHLGIALVDGDVKEFWAASKETTAEEPQSFTVSGGRFQASSIGLLPGPTTHARPKKVEVVQSDTSRTYELPDKAMVHWLELPPLVGYTGSGVGPITVKILEVHPGTASPAPAIAEVKLKATLVEAF
jgi:hypothetical protein